jgi:hypothetical protein
MPYSYIRKILPDIEIAYGKNRIKPVIMISVNKLATTSEFAFIKSQGSKNASRQLAFRQERDITCLRISWKGSRQGS